MRELLEMQSIVHAYRDFEECVVESISWSDYLTSVQVLIDYVWKPDGSVRPDQEDRALVEITFSLVQEFEMHNALNPAVVDDPSMMNWGRNEIARLVIVDDDRSHKYAGYLVPFHHAILRWESKTWIDIVFAEMEISERTGAPRVVHEW